MTHSPPVYWMPPPPPTSTPTLTPSPVPSSTPRPTPTSTPTPEPTATRVEDLGTGDVQVTLTWDSVNDLDLWVTDPADETIYYHNKTSASGGELDVDANPGCNDLTSSPVENIFWPTGDSPEGTYTIYVQYYDVCQPEARTPFTVRLQVNGETQIFTGVASEQNEKIEIHTFELQR